MMELVVLKRDGVTTYGYVAYVEQTVNGLRELLNLHKLNTIHYTYEPKLIGPTLSICEKAAGTEVSHKLDYHAYTTLKDHVNCQECKEWMYS